MGGGKEGERRGKQRKGTREDGTRGEAGHPRFSDGLAPLDRIIPVTY